MKNKTQIKQEIKTTKQLFDLSSTSTEMSKFGSLIPSRCRTGFKSKSCGGFERQRWFFEMKNGDGFLLGFNRERGENEREERETPSTEREKCLE